MEYCTFHNIELDEKTLIEGQCLKKGCWHWLTVDLVSGNCEYKFPIKKYRRTTNPNIKLRDLINEVNSGINVDFDYWESTLRNIGRH